MSSVLHFPAISQWVADGREHVGRIRRIDETTAQHDALASESRRLGLAARIEFGNFLISVRESMPKRGTAENGWKAYLEAIEVDDSTAHRYMGLARDAASGILTSQNEELRRSEGAQPDPDAPPHTDDDAPREATETTEPEVDRDTWCTPEWLAKLLGRWDLDPCSNARSHINAKKAFDLELRGENGLELAAKVKKATRVFVNPPYSDVAPWVESYGHTRFCFLVKFDPSTAWCAELLAKTSLVLFPKKDGERSARIAFEPPPGVPNPGGHQFPHGLFFARADDAPKALQAACFRFAHKR